MLFPAESLLPYKNSNKVVFVKGRKHQLKCVMCFLFNHSASFITFLFVGAGHSCAMVHIRRTPCGSGSKFSPGLLASISTCCTIWLPLSLLPNHSPMLSCLKVGMMLSQPGCFILSDIRRDISIWVRSTAVCQKHSCIIHSRHGF